MGESPYETSRQRLLKVLRNVRRLHPQRIVIRTHPTAEDRQRAQELADEIGDEIGEDVIRSRE